MDTGAHYPAPTFLVTITLCKYQHRSTRHLWPDDVIEILLRRSVFPALLYNTKHLESLSLLLYHIQLRSIWT